MTILTAVLFALTQEPPPLEPRVAAYALQLRDDATRDRARDHLVHMGTPALIFLEKLALDPGILDSIRQEIVLNQSLGASYGPPSYFSFDGSGESLGVVLSRLETASGMSFQKNSVDLSQKIALRLNEATFWETLDEICRKASIRYSLDPDPMYFSSGLPAANPRAYYGSVVIVMDRVYQQRRVTFDKTESECKIRLLCQWERSIAPLGLTGKYQLTEVTDDSGASLVDPEAQAPVGPRPTTLVRTGGQPVDLAGLRFPSPKAKTLARVEGTVELEFPSQIDEIRFNTSAELAPVPIGISGNVVELKSFARQSNWTAVAEFAIRFRDGPEAANFRISPTDVTFVVPGDIPRTGLLAGVRVEKNVYSFSVHWRTSGRQELPKEIRLRVPRGSVLKNLPFCFKDVELK